MKTKILTLIAGFLLFISCNKTTDTPPENILPDEEVKATQRQCGAYEVLLAQLAADPSQAQRMAAIEEFTRRVIENPQAYRLENGRIVIPVIVNVLYNTPAQNISEAQILSQIAVLNADFEGTNTDYNAGNYYNAVKAGDVGVSFVIDNPATDIIRKATKKKTWQLNDGMKKSRQGGIDPTDPATKLNIWVCNLARGYLGYAQFPGGPLSTDGVVVDDNAFGTIGTAEAPFDKGRTATHEIGHWMNLRHIWGDANCGNDFVGDTPEHNTANYGCPSAGHLSTCSGNPVEMTWNYMDYTDDACMYMFSSGQKSRMQAVFAAGGPRVLFAQ